MNRETKKQVSAIYNAQKKRQAFSRKSECTGSVHDYENAIRNGRAWYVCPNCGKDISLEYVMYMDAVQRVETMGGTVTPNEKDDLQERSK